MRRGTALICLLATTLTLSPAAGAREVPITILHTTDVHGYILPGYDYDGNEGVGGMLRCSSLIRKIRAEAPNVLLVDCGDTVQGAPEGFRTDGRLPVRVLEKLDYDAWVIGNHEFDWGWEKLKALHDGTTLDMLGANLGTVPGRPPVLPKVKPYRLMEVDGVRVVFVGLTTPGIPSWSLPFLLGDILVSPSLETLHEVMPAVRKEEPDILVLLLHQGYKPYGDDHANEIKRIVRRFPEFDLVLGGHTHKVVESVEINGVLYTQAGYHGNWVGRVDLLYDTVSRELLSRSARVIPTSDTVPLDEELHACFRDELDATQAFLDEVVGSTRRALTARAVGPGQSVHQELICRAIEKAVRCDFVIHGSLDDREVPAGVLREKDIWKVVPYENRIGVARLTSAQIREILEENASALGGFYFMGVHGLRYRLDAGAPRGQRVSDIRTAAGKPLHPRKRYRVAFNSYALASAGLRLKRLRAIAHEPESRVTITRVDTRDAVRRYIREHSPLDLEARPAVEVVERDDR